MRRRISISALFLAVAFAIPSLAADELTLQVPQRKSVRPITGTHDLAMAFDVAPHLSTEAEPNDTLENANVIALPGRFSGTTAFADPASISIDYSDGVSARIADIYVLTLEHATAVGIDLTWGNTEADLDLFVFEKMGERLNLIEGSARASAAAETVQTRVLEPGTYYIGVSAFSGSASYNLALSEITGFVNCIEDTTTMCLNGGRFRVRATWTSGSNSGNAGAVPLTTDTGFLWFFNNANVELVVKVLDACSLNSRFWVFAGGLTDVGVRLTITDTVAGVTKEYVNNGGQAFQPVQDTSAFATCSASACTYTLNPSSLAFNSSGGSGSFNVNTQTGCNWTAVSNSSFITVTGGASGTGSGVVSYSVAANSSASSRSGTITAGGQTYTVTQSGASGGSFDGTWNGTTTQSGKTISFVVSNNTVTSVMFSYRATGSCTVDGTVNTTYTPGRAITGNSFTLTGSGPTSFTINGTFNSSTSASGTLSVSFSQSFPSCSASGSGTWSATK
ncbi:MAG TPA: PPC domain-containing protein [Thermoanaerobaculia bacterium]|nr:PPC domain-containing protein [Thermoanaerobaculia bacterium]